MEQAPEYVRCFNFFSDTCPSLPTPKSVVVRAGQVKRYTVVDNEIPLTTVFYYHNENNIVEVLKQKCGVETVVGIGIELYR